MTTDTNTQDALTTYCDALRTWRAMDDTNSTYRQRMDAYQAMSDALMALKEDVRVKVLFG